MDSQESSTPQFKSINSSALSLLYGPTLISIHDYWKNHSFDMPTMGQKADLKQKLSWVHSRIDFRLFARHLIMDAVLDATQQPFMSLDHLPWNSRPNGFQSFLHQSIFSHQEAVECKSEKAWALGSRCVQSPVPSLTGWSWDILCNYSVYQFLFIKWGY